MSLQTGASQLSQESVLEALMISLQDVSFVLLQRLMEGSCGILGPGSCLDESSHPTFLETATSLLFHFP